LLSQDVPEKKLDAQGPNEFSEVRMDEEVGLVLGGHGSPSRVELA